MDRLEGRSYDPGMLVCGRCGEENPDRARFCLACAAPIRAPAGGRREERKRVSVLFCDLVGFTSRAERLDVEDVRGVLASYHTRLRTELERRGGTVEKFIGDAVMALFGAPVAHEDDPERAVRAALAIREAIAELNERDASLDLHVRVGVTTGEALVVLDARPADGEAMASGDVVNTAARLQAAAPTDGVLVDPTTFRATDRRIVFRRAAPVVAKGKLEPLAVWEALEARASLGVDIDQAPQTALVGRERELDLLRGALARVRDEQAPHLLTLVGVPGMGKSRLVWELLQQVEAEAELTTWRQGRCLPYGEGVALWALGEVVKAQAGILDSDPAGRATVKLVHAVAGLVADRREAAWVTGHLRPLVGLAARVELGGDHRAEAFAAWRRFLEALAEQGPTVLVVEDLHWADEALLDFLDYLVDSVAEVPLLVVATTRPELLARRLGWAGDKPNAATVSLAPLTEQDTTRLVGQLLDQAVLPAPAQAALLARAGGNPLYAEEYVRMLADRGFRRPGGSWRLDHPEELPLPETVQGIIAARLDGLPPEEKALLQDAAVLGKVGWLGALVVLGGTEPAAVEQGLRALERRELLRRQRRSTVVGERQYAFRHVLVRDVAYRQLPRAARAGKHRRAAEWLQALSPDRAEDRAELLGHHWQAALQYARAAGQETGELAGRARTALRDAGARALELNAFAAAARWYEAALELWSADDQERPLLYLELGRARFHAEQAGGELLAEARDGLVAQGDRERAAEAECMLGELFWQQGLGQPAIAHMRRAVALLRDAAPSPAKAFALTQLAAILMTNGQSGEAIQVARQALAMAEALGDDDLRGQALNYIGCLRVEGGDRGGVEDLEESVALAVRANPPESARAYLNLADVVITLGDLTRGFDLKDRAYEAAERFGLASDLRHAKADRAFRHYWQGRWDAALDAADRFLTEVEAGSPHYMEGPCRQLRGWIRLARGDPAAALADAASAVALARETMNLESLVPALAFHARTLLANGQADQAGGQADELLAELADRGALLTNPDWSGQLAIVLSSLGRAAELAELAAGVSKATSWLRAAAAMAAGDFERAADTYARIGSRPDEAFARLRGAERLLDAGHQAEGKAQLQRAMAFFRQAGASGHLREAEALVAATA
jgi:class 3 adenylate cyclase/tetratricopeptide (TPR) repeat protein